MSNETGISVLIRTSNSEKPLRAEEAGARVIRNDGPFNYSRTLNIGFHAARNAQVLVLSVHCLPVNRDFLERYRRVLLQLPEAWAVVYGMQVYSKKQYDRSDKAPVVCARIEDLARLSGGGNPNALYSKRAWEMHRFEESLKTGEDLEWLNWAARTELISAKAMEACVFYRHTGGPIYRFKKACDEVWIFGDNRRPVSAIQLAIGVAHASRYLLWEEFLPRAWIGQVSHVLGAFVASRKLVRPK
jgi:hypothetical protein